ncbi:MAG: hypothetical protein QOE46_1205 [Acidobacteriota bacterium]|jgi:uncharacterized membrane protein|nr:hypothetical protein [Acidobacteriota bacterium]
MTARLLRWSPLLVFFVLALPLPAYFLFRYFTVTENPGEYMLFALTSLGVFSVFGIVAAFIVVLYRRFWERRLRERVAADGVTADELSLFTSELTPEQRRTLREVESRNPLLADAYRETLAARVTAARVVARARVDAALVKRRLKTASALQAAGRAALEQDLQQDRARLERVEHEADEHAREMDARLQMIEAIASRDASQAETELALKRLGSVRENLPLALNSVREEQQAREEVEQEMRQLPTPPEERPGL